MTRLLFLVNTHMEWSLYFTHMRPQEHNFSTMHNRISDYQRLWPHFKYCIGAIDGTHILATPTPQDYVRYIGISKDVILVVDFDMCFTYASIP